MHRVSVHLSAENALLLDAVATAVCVVPRHRRRHSRDDAARRPPLPLGGVSLRWRTDGLRAGHPCCAWGSPPVHHPARARCTSRRLGYGKSCMEKNVPCEGDVSSCSTVCSSAQRLKCIQPGRSTEGMQSSCS